MAAGSAGAAQGFAAPPPSYLANRAPVGVRTKPQLAIAYRSPAQADHRRLLLRAEWSRVSPVESPGIAKAGLAVLGGYAANSASVPTHQARSGPCLGN